MNIGVRGGDPRDYSIVSVEEKNRTFGMLKSHTPGCLTSGHTIYVNVPPKVSGITCQTDPDAWNYLVKSFELAMRSASENDHPAVAIPELGVAYQKWKHLQSASAARNAIENLWEDLPDDFTVFFCVPYDQVELWNQVLTF